MKKNKMMRAASALLVAVLLTTCAVSGTFAKYTTAGTGTDTARVAEWGVTVTASGNDVFATEYKDKKDDGGKTVSSKGGTTAEVIAPGTNGDLGGIAITGQPEVMVDIVVTGDLELTGWEIDAVEYCPLIFNVGGEIVKIDGSTIKTIDELESAVEAKFLALSANDVPAKTDLTRNVSVTWTWPIDVNDTNDTALGNLANAPTIAFNCSASVTQVD